LFTRVCYASLCRLSVEDEWLEFASDWAPSIDGGPEVTPLITDMSHLEHPIKVLDQKDRVTRRKHNQVLQDTMEQPH
jgi:hypothetical protein